MKRDGSEYDRKTRITRYFSKEDARKIIQYGSGSTGSVSTGG
jgi:hypothetical protein